MKNLLIVLFSTFALSSIYGQKVEQVTLSGKVIDNLSSQPLEYATVVAKNLKDNKVFGGITSPQGTF